MSKRSMRSLENRVAVLLAITMFNGLVLQTQAAGVDCMDTESALNYWRPVRERAPTSEEPADTMALELLGCLASPDKELRDRIGYELFAYWLRGEKIGDNTRRMLLKDLSSMMSEAPAAIPGDSTFARSFSALILSEIMRSDANRPFMTAAERQALLDRTILSLGRENDFRGLDADAGWVHPIAHMADLLWRFALHPDTTAEQALAIIDGVRAKVAPTGVSYAFNEGDRLARVVAAIIQKEIIEPESVAVWFRTFEKPQSMDRWSDAFQNPRGMAELHNTKQFFRALSDQLADIEVDPTILETLDALVRSFTRLI